MEAIVQWNQVVSCCTYSPQLQWRRFRPPTSPFISIRRVCILILYQPTPTWSRLELSASSTGCSTMYWPFSLFSSQQEAETESDELEESPPALQVDLLRHYEVSGVPLPPSARVGDPSLKQRESQPIRLWHLWKLSLLIAVKGQYRRRDCF